MKFGYFCNTTNWTHKPYHELLDETREITEYCDQSKWDSIWYTEHHFNHEGMESLTNPEPYRNLKYLWDNYGIDTFCNLKVLPYI